MTAGTRPSRRTERAAPLPVPLRVTAASSLVAAMMMSFLMSAPLPPGVSVGRLRAVLIGEAGAGGKGEGFAYGRTTRLAFRISIFQGVGAWFSVGRGSLSVARRFAQNGKRA